MFLIEYHEDCPRYECFDLGPYHARSMPRSIGALHAAECIITGDEDLLVLGLYGPVRILSPAKFADFEARRK
jgi:hypothetical protein